MGMSSSHTGVWASWTAHLPDSRVALIRSDLNSIICPESGCSRLYSIPKLLGHQGLSFLSFPGTMLFHASIPLAGRDQVSLIFVWLVFLCTAKVWLSLWRYSMAFFSIKVYRDQEKIHKERGESLSSCQDPMSKHAKANASKPEEPNVWDLLLFL